MSVDRVDIFKCNGCPAEHRAPEQTIEVPLGWVRITADVGDEAGVAQDVDLCDDAFMHFCDGCQNALLLTLTTWKARDAT